MLVSQVHISNTFLDRNSIVDLYIIDKDYANVIPINEHNI